MVYLIVKAAGAGLKHRLILHYAAARPNSPISFRQWQPAGLRQTWDNTLPLLYFRRFMGAGTV